MRRRFRGQTVDYFQSTLYSKLLLLRWARHSLLKNPLSLNFSVGSSSSSEDPLLSLSLLLSLPLSRRRDLDFLLFFSFFFSFFLFFSFFFLLFFSDGQGMFPHLVREGLLDFK